MDMVIINIQLNEDQIILKYRNDKEKDDGIIAGIRDLNRKVFGIMPHPERLPYNEDLKKKLMDIIFPKVNEEVISKIKIFKNFNNGIIDIGEGYSLCLKIKSYPISIDPFSEASEGVGNIIKNIFTTGARPIALLDFLRFGTDEKAVEIEEKTIQGISYYGNGLGVPVIGGDYYVDKIYDKNPVINIGCIGIVKKEDIICERSLKEDNFIYYITSKEGKEDLNDPFIEKILLETCCELVEGKEYNPITGMESIGEGGIFYASLNMLMKSGNDSLGCDINLDKILVEKYMKPTEILIKCDQKSILVVCDCLSKIKEFCDKWDLEYRRIGNITNNGKYTVFNEEHIVYDKPVKDLIYIKDLEEIKNQPKIEKNKIKKNINKWSVYDSTLGGRTIKGPLELGSYSILDLYEIGKKLYIVWGESREECVSKIKKINKNLDIILDISSFSMTIGIGII